MVNRLEIPLFVLLFFIKTLILLLKFFILKRGKDSIGDTIRIYFAHEEHSYKKT